MFGTRVRWAGAVVALISAWSAGTAVAPSGPEPHAPADATVVQRQYTVPAHTTHAAYRATCPAGTTILDGGHYEQGTVDGVLEVLDAYTDVPSNSYVIGVNNDSPDAARVVVHATCT
ncbi:hypothetical protein [Streptomyces sp. AM8-1-1]|uniref:hypothetical protein n=1 Tax=Streptomyces sp. AM8-1-1 TaxID=3075825 RepID=UPI0028C48999|nr:hypothetical protein [Streptomyces sp. AM8-1-1]WNO70206.1 hypothetical protein RPQ07_00520 [Streptomyces sp. AM8-1-1]